MDIKKNRNLFLTVTLIFFLIIIVVLLTIIKQQNDADKFNPGNKEDWVGAFIEANSKTEGSQNNLQRHPANENQLFIDGFFNYYENNILAIDTNEKTYKIKVNNDIQVLIIDESLSREEKLKSLKRVNLSELNKEDRVTVSVILENSQLTALSVSKHINY